MVLPFESLSHPLVIAHRGSMTLGPENTIYSFDLALSAGADVLETDVHPSADGEIMVIHDSSLDRTSNGSGQVRALPRKALQELDFAWNFSLDEKSFPLRGQGITIPTLEELFDRFPDQYFSIDIKEDDLGFAAEVVKLVLRMGKRDRVSLASFHPDVAELLRTSTPPLFVAADRPQALRLLRSRLPGFGLKGELPSSYMLPDHVGPLPIATPALIAQVHRAGRRCYFWTIDTEPAMRRVLASGADGIITNRPDLLFAVRKELLERPAG